LGEPGSRPIATPTTLLRPKPAVTMDMYSAEAHTHMPLLGNLWLENVDHGGCVFDISDEMRMDVQAQGKGSRWGSLFRRTTMGSMPDLMEVEGDPTSPLTGLDSRLATLLFNIHLASNLCLFLHL